MSTAQSQITYDKAIRDKMLAVIQQRMKANPNLGNYYIWYYDVYKQANKKPAVYLEAIQAKYDRVAPADAERLTLMRKNEPEQ